MIKRRGWRSEGTDRSVSFLLVYGAGVMISWKFAGATGACELLSAPADHLGAGRRIGESLSHEWRIRDRGWILIG
jgi:hypothetical protein